jgi:hypothetical protein
MGIIYLDQNYISDVAGHTRCGDSQAERHAAFSIAETGKHRFAVSVWNMYETARAPKIDTRQGYLEFIERVDPCMCSNPSLVQFQELISFLSGCFDQVPYRYENPTPFQDTPARMWATFGSAPPLVGETFRDCVEMLRARRSREALEKALDEGPQLLKVVREALNRGDIERDKSMLDREWLFTLFPERNPADGTWVDIRQRKAIVDFLLSRMDEVHQRCRCIYAAEQIYKYRISGQRKARRSDGPDIQFAVLAVAYCDYIVTNDSALREMIEFVAHKTGSTCLTLSRLSELRE